MCPEMQHWRWNFAWCRDAGIEIMLGGTSHELNCREKFKFQHCATEYNFNISTAFLDTYPQLLCALYQWYIFSTLSQTYPPCVSERSSKHCFRHIPLVSVKDLLYFCTNIESCIYLCIDKPSNTQQMNISVPNPGNLQKENILKRKSKYILLL